MINNALRKSIEEYCEKRNAAIIAAVMHGDIEPMKRLAEKVDQSVPNDYVLLVSAHKMCLHIPTMDDEVKSKSMKWLQEHGFKEGIY